MCSTKEIEKKWNIQWEKGEGGEQSKWRRVQKGESNWRCRCCWWVRKIQAENWPLGLARERGTVMGLGLESGGVINLTGMGLKASGFKRKWVGNEVDSIRVLNLRERLWWLRGNVGIEKLLFCFILSWEYYIMLLFWWEQHNEEGQMMQKGEKISAGLSYWVDELERLGSVAKSRAWFWSLFITGWSTECEVCQWITRFQLWRTGGGHLGERLERE